MTNDTNKFGYREGEGTLFPGPVRSIRWGHGHVREGQWRQGSSPSTAAAEGPGGGRETSPGDMACGCDGREESIGKVLAEAGAGGWVGGWVRVRAGARV